LLLQCPQIFHDWQRELEKMKWKTSDASHAHR
jgi:hypothetical protein